MLEKLRTIYTPVESDAAARLDRYFIDKAVDNISQETDIDRLLEKFLDIAVKSTGADKGCLVFERDGELFVEAIKDNAPSVTTRKTIVLKECNAVSKSIIRYVARTLETVVLNHKEEAGIFAGDCYIAEAGTKSIACLPLLLQSIPFGVLYLENSLLPGVFSADRLEILKLLSAQVAYMKSLQSYLQEDTRDTRESDDKTNGKLVDSLTKRETEVLSMIAAGHSNKEIADRLEITMNTAKTHIKNIYGKLQVNRRVQAVERAKKLNLL
jgi:DNA-binding CsgD family transcriptional regulator